MNDIAAEANRLRGLLEDCIRLQDFEKDSRVTKEWITANIATMNDGCHLDPTNLNAKIQNHKDHEQDILSRKPHIEEIIK